MADATHNRSHRSASDCLCSVTIGPAACMGQLGINGRLGCHKFAQTLLSTRSRCLHLAKFATCFFRFALCARPMSAHFDFADAETKRTEPNSLTFVVAAIVVAVELFARSPTIYYCRPKASQLGARKSPICVLRQLQHSSPRTQVV